MYSNAEKKNKSKNTPSIFQLASKVQQEVEGKDEAALIMNAYRRVEDIRVLSSNSYDGIKKTKQGAQQIRKPESSYANKVKETLKQLNANRKKEIEVNRQPPKPVTNEKISNKGPAERYLIQNGLKRLIKILDKKYDKNIAYGLQQILNVGSLTSSRYDEMIRLWKLRRMFSGWQYETMLLKIQKEKQVKIQKQKEKNQNRLAEDFHYFWSIKNFFKSWNSHVRRQLKKRQLELQENLKRQEQLKALLEQKNNHGQQERKRQIKANVELQNKLRGFLDGLKQQINGKQRLNTVKQKTEQQEMKQDSQRGLDGHQENENQVILQNQHENVPQNNEVAQERQESEYHGPLTNEDLEKKRKQLQKKAKQRKQALQKLKKDREKKKKQESQQKQAIERQIEEQQKKARQEQYRRFLKLKKEQEQWKARQKQLEKQADQFNRLRVMKFHGWIYWTKLKKTNQQRNKYLASLLAAIFMKRALENFVNGIMQRGEINLKKKQEKMNEYFRRNLKKRCVKKLEQWRNQQKQLKEELQIRHQVNSLKIYFKEWQRCRNQIQLQNYEWERPRIKRAECLHGMTLLHKAWQSLKLNRDREIENRNVQEHKAKIKEKFHKIVEQQPTINYDDFL